MAGLDPSLLEQPPPRELPLSVRLRPALNVLTVMGLGFTLFSLPFLLIAGDPRDLLVDRRLDAGASRAQGTVLGVEDAGVEVNDVPLRRVRFAFQAGGTRYEGRSYTTDGSVLRALSRGSPVAVEHDPSDPRLSRAEGTRFAAAPGWVFLLVGLFPLLGLGMLAGGVMAAAQQARLLTHGVVAYAKVEKVWAMPMGPRSLPRFVVRYAFADQLGAKRTGMAETSTPPTEGEAVQVVYLPERPEGSALLQELVSGRTGPWASGWQGGL